MWRGSPSRLDRQVLDKFAAKVSKALVSVGYFLVVGIGSTRLLYGRVSRSNTCTRVGCHLCPCSWKNGRGVAGGEVPSILDHESSGTQRIRSAV